MSPTTRTLLRCLAGGVLLTAVLALPAMADDRPTTPAPAFSQDTKELINEIQRKFRDARNADTPTLLKLAEEIRGLIAKLKEADPKHAKIAEFEKRIDKMIADSYANDIREAKGEFERRTSRIEFYLERNNESERPQLKEQRDLLAEALKKYEPALLAAGDEGKELLEKTKAALQKADAQIGTAMAGDALANEWIAKLNVYAWNGEKDMTHSANSAAAYAHIKALKAEAEQLWAEYQKVDFGAALTDELKSAADTFQRALAKAEENLGTALNSRKQAAEEKVKYIEDWFAQDKDWESDKSKMPRAFHAPLLTEARAAIDELGEFVADDPAVAKLKERHDALVKENGKRQEARKAATLMRPDKYKGDDAEALKKFAAKILDKPKYKGVKCLRVTIFTPEWKEETVTEWTDTTHSAIRTRTTRQLMACFATEHKDGVFRMFGYLFQDRQSDGSWGSTYGHLTDTRDPMLKDNINKDEAE